MQVQSGGGGTAPVDSVDIISKYLDMLNRTSSNKETRKKPDSKITSGRGINLGGGNNVAMLTVDM